MAAEWYCYTTTSGIGMLTPLYSFAFLKSLMIGL